MPERLRLETLRLPPVHLPTEGWLALAVVVLGGVWTVTTPHFLTLANAVDLVESYSVTAVLAMGLFVVLVSGGIDISFFATASVAQYVTAVLAVQAGWPPAACLAAALLIGVALGLANAAFIHYARVTSIIVTIATLSIYFSLLMYFTSGRSIYDLPDWWARRVTLWRLETAGGDIVRITLPIVVMVAVVGLTWLMMNRTTLGRKLYALGGNPEGARRIGISPAAMTALAYGYLGLLAGVAGLLQAHRVGESVPNALVGNELNVLAAAVLGGASLTGGIGSVGGVILGILLLAMLQNGLNLLGVSPYFFQIIIGAVILISTSATGRAGRAPRRRVTGAPP